MSSRFDQLTSEEIKALYCSLQMCITAFSLPAVSACFMYDTKQIKNFRNVSGALLAELAEIVNQGSVMAAGKE